MVWALGEAPRRGHDDDLVARPRRERRRERAPREVASSPAEREATSGPAGVDSCAGSRALPPSLSQRSIAARSAAALTMVLSLLGIRMTFVL